MDEDARRVTHCVCGLFDKDSRKLYGIVVGPGPEVPPSRPRPARLLNYGGMDYLPDRLHGLSLGVHRDG